MNHSIVAVALTSALVCLSSAQADHLGYSNLEARLNKIEAQLAGRDSIQQIAYYGGCSDSCGCDSEDSDCCSSSCGCSDSCNGGSCGCGSSCCDQCCNSCCNGCCGCGAAGGSGGFFTEIELMFMRAHLLENTGGLGKLSEEYEIAPRVVVGYENNCGQGFRVRYWHYGHQSNSINTPAGVRFEWDVLDFEVSNRFQFARSDVTLSGGIRLAGTEITAQNASVDNDLIGLTVAADAETLLCCDCCNYWSFIYGGRLAVLGGDWEGANPVVGAVRDDNVVVTELHLGFEYGCCYCGYDLYTQLKFEIQNWHSDAMSAATGTDSLGFVGPAWTIGVGF